MYHSTVGSSIVVKEMFLSTSGTPLLPDMGIAPLVALFDSDNDVIMKVDAMPGNIPGEWLSTITIPIFEIAHPLELYILWRFKDSHGNYHHIRDAVVVAPSENRDSEWVVFDSDDGFTATFPFAVNNDTFKVKLYSDNNEVHSWIGNGTLVGNTSLYDISASSSSGSIVYFPFDKIDKTVFMSSIHPYMVIASSDSTKSSSWLFVVNPSIISASMALEEYINKARLSNVIPELQYRTSDLLLYLDRGLSLFNSYPPQITGFNGRAMAGPLKDCWLICSAYYILTAQIQAEGASAFDFSGQSVTLSVDRTSSIESAIGRLEGMIDNTVKPFKKNLVKSGVSGGDGNVNGSLSFGQNFGRLMLTNNPISQRTGGFGFGSRIISNFPFRRGVF